MAAVSTMEFDYDRETALTSTGAGRFSTELSSAWNIGENPNGGYLLAPVLQAMQQVSGHPDPLTVTTHYLRPGAAGPAEIEADALRSGRTVGTVRGRLSQDGRTKLESIAAFTDLDIGKHVADVGRPPVELPPPDDCPSRLELPQGVDLAIMDRVDVRIHPDHVASGTRSTPDISGWIRFSDERPIDAASLTLFADAFPPSVFSLLGRIGWVPTIELTVQVRRRPVNGWIRAHFETSDLSNQRLIEDGWLWDESGALVAMSRQVGLVLVADE